MHTLILLRHAHAAPATPALDDLDRPLDARGKNEARATAQSIAATPPPSPLIVSSPARRAWDTATTVAEALGLGSGAIRREPQLYLASANQICALLQTLDDDTRCVLLCGHNPGLSDCARTLSSTRRIRDLRPCGRVELQLSDARWAAITPGCATFERESLPPTYC